MSPPRILPPSRQCTHDDFAFRADAMIDSRVGPVGLRKQAIQRLRESQHFEIEQRLAYERARQAETTLVSSIASHQQHHAISSPSKIRSRNQGLLRQLNQLHSFLNIRVAPASAVESSTRRLRRSTIWSRQTASRLAKTTASNNTCSGERDANCIADAAEQAHADDAPRSLLKTMRLSTRMRSRSSSNGERDANRIADAAEQAIPDDAPRSLLKTMRRSALMRFYVLVAHAEAKRKDEKSDSERPGQQGRPMSDVHFTTSDER
jgi:hypothetical protein